MPQILGEDGRRDGQHRALGMGQAMTAYLGEDHPGQGAAAARAHDQYIARVAGQIDGFRSCASCLVRGLVLEEACPAAGGTRAQRAGTDADRLGERSHLAHPGIVMQTHIDDVASVLSYDDLRGVILAGTSSSGAVISGVADRVPERISPLVYLDAFVPGDGQAVFDLIPPQRQPQMEMLVETEGFGWLLPRFAAQPWEQFVRQACQVADEAQLR